jgi:hypothetical protein
MSGAMTRRCLLGGSLAGIGVLLPHWWWRERDASAEPGPVAAVHGTAVGSSPGPAARPAPLSGLSVTLLPRSESVLARLEALRAGSRDSLKAYRSAMPEMRRLLESTIDELQAAGQGAAIRSAEVDSEGRFVLADVPPGSWMLVAYRSVHVSPRGRDSMKESGTFLPQPRLVGYERVSMWLDTVTVEPGRPAQVGLTDRNVWFEGVVEQTAAREQVPRTGNSRRSAR